MNKSDLKPNTIIKVMDFIGVILETKETPDGLFVTVESPKRIALHQTSLDVLLYDKLPRVWNLATPIELIVETRKWFGIDETHYKEKTNAV